jgi:hypothetical protein
MDVALFVYKWYLDVGTVMKECTVCSPAINKNAAFQCQVVMYMVMITTGIEPVTSRYIGISQNDSHGMKSLVAALLP